MIYVITVNKEYNFVFSGDDVNIAESTAENLMYLTGYIKKKKVLFVTARKLSFIRNDDEDLRDDRPED